jgi:hypothetical protein
MAVADSQSSILPAGGGGSMLVFDGVNDRVQIAASPSLMYPGSGGWTVEAWLRLDTFAGAVSEAIVGQESVCEPDDDPYSLRVVNDNVQWILSESQAVTETLTAPIESGRWVHVAGVYDGDDGLGRTELYVDGVQVAGRATGVMPASQLEPVFIGNIGLECFGQPSIDGAIDEVRIWSHARSQAEIRAAMFTRLAGNEAELKGYWLLDDGVGQMVLDHSPNRNHGWLGENPFDADAQDPSWAVSTAPLGPPPCPADFNEDGQLSILDFVAFQVVFSAKHPSADFNGDGAANILDFVTYQTAFQAGCP